MEETSLLEKTLGSLSPDELSPKEALEVLYKIKKLLDQK